MRGLGSSLQIIQTNSYILNICHSAYKNITVCLWRYSVWLVVGQTKQLKNFRFGVRSWFELWSMFTISNTKLLLTYSHTGVVTLVIFVFEHKLLDQQN